MAKSPYADLPEPLKKCLPDMFASYPNLGAPTPSSWFVWTGDKVLARNQAYCHVNMVYDGLGWDELITAVPKNDQLSLEYLRMLIRGPFRSFSDLIKLDRVKDNYYLHCLSLDKWPANVLMNFCISSRIPIEFQFLLKPWALRCEIGFDPTLAFLLTYSYGCKFGNTEQFPYRSFNMARGGHMWLDPASNWSNILHGLMPNVSKPFKTYPSLCRPTNNIWGICDDYKMLKDMTDDEIAAFYTQPVVVLEPPPPPIFPKKFKKLFDPGQAPHPHEHPLNHIAIAVANLGDWGLAPQHEPQPQPNEPIHVLLPEDLLDEPEDDWFEPEDDDALD